VQGPRSGPEVGDLLNREAGIVDLAGSDGLFQPNDASAIGERQILEQNAVDDAEDGCVRADAER